MIQVSKRVLDIRNRHTFCNAAFGIDMLTTDVNDVLTGECLERILFRRSMEFVELHVPPRCLEFRARRHSSAFRFEHRGRLDV